MRNQLHSICYWVTFPGLLTEATLWLAVSFPIELIKFRTFYAGILFCQCVSKPLVVLCTSRFWLNLLCLFWHVRVVSDLWKVFAAEFTFIAIRQVFFYWHPNISQLTRTMFFDHWDDNIQKTSSRSLPQNPIPKYFW